MFVQIGDKAFSPSLVTDVHLDEDGKRVTLYFAGQDAETLPLEFEDDEYDLFLDWWERKAEVDRR